MHCMTTLIAIITTLIAAIVAYIAVQQYLLARERFKLDLFEKRFAVFKATETFINAIVGARSSSVEDFSGWHKRFSLETQTASFLFDTGMADFIDELAIKGNRVTVAKILNTEPRVGANIDAIDWALGDAKIIQEEFINIQNQLRDRFSPYLRSKNWK
jgi:hypothetical protein